MTQQAPDAQIATIMFDPHNTLRIHVPIDSYFSAQLPIIRSYADLRVDRIAEIQMQIYDILSFFGAIMYLDSERHSSVLELLDAVARLAIRVEMQVKHILRSIRPIDRAYEVQPIIQTPDHSSYPSGHACEAFAVATVAYRLMTGEGPRHGITAGAQVFRLAERIAVNRTVAGVHYPVDSFAGAVLGCHLGNFVYARSTSTCSSYVTSELGPFNGNDRAVAPEEGDDFSLNSLEDLASITDDYPSLPHDPIIERLWEKAGNQVPASIRP